MTGTEPRHRDWVKLWVKEALIGTIREDLTPEERGTWYDFLLLAGNSRIPGVICANKTSALPVKRIAGILNIEETLVRRCIKKFKESGRIIVDKNGVISIVNWSRYQYSDYDRQKPYREAKGQTEPKKPEDVEEPSNIPPPPGWDEIKKTQTMPADGPFGSVANESGDDFSNGVPEEPSDIPPPPQK